MSMQTSFTEQAAIQGLQKRAMVGYKRVLGPDSAKYLNASFAVSNSNMPAQQDLQAHVHLRAGQQVAWRQRVS